jgi:hypothetical protein
MIEEPGKNVKEIERPWRLHVVMRSRKQRRTGKVIIVSEVRLQHGPTYIEFTNPVHAAEHAFRMLKCGGIVAWESGEQDQPRRSGARKRARRDISPSGIRSNDAR